MHVLFYIGLALKVVAPKPRARNCPFFALLNGCACVTLLCYIYLLFCFVYIYLYATTTPSRTKKNARWPQGRCTKQNDYPSTRSPAQLIK